MNVRRGLGRGLGALIPPAPEVTNSLTATSTSTPSTDAEEAVEETGSADEQPETSAGSQGREADASATESGPGTGADGGPTAVDGAIFAEVPVEAIGANPRQPRQIFDDEALAELVHSIKEIGLLQPIVVREQPDGRYELVMGERRWRAAQQAGLSEIPAIVRQTADDAMLRDALLENLHRVELNPLEEAAAYGQLLEDFGCTHDELAQRIGRSRPQITNTLRLLKLSASVQRRVAAGVLSAGHARALLGVSSAETQERLAQRAVAEGLSVRALEEIVSMDTGEERPERPQRRPKPVSPRLSELGDRLSDRFETRVKVDLGKNRGKITVEFASLDDLERIVGLMDPKRDES